MGEERGGDDAWRSARHKVGGERARKGKGVDSADTRVRVHDREGVAERQALLRLKLPGEEQGAELSEGGVVQPEAGRARVRPVPAHLVGVDRGPVASTVEPVQLVGVLWRRWREYPAPSLSPLLPCMLTHPLDLLLPRAAAACPNPAHSSSLSSPSSPLSSSTSRAAIRAYGSRTSSAPRGPCPTS
jgi:hypothetical protein